MWGGHLAFEGLAFGCFVLLLVLEARRHWLTLRIVAVGAAVLLAVALSFPPRESADVWSYVMYGRIVLHGDDPYTTPPNRFPHDRWLHLVRPVWRRTPSLYGPLFDLTAAGVVWSAHGSALRARFGFQLLAALGVAGMLVLLWRRSRDPTAVALVGLNPLVVEGVVNGGHNDALVGLGVLAGVILAGDRRRVVAGILLGLAALVKVVALVPAAVVIVWLWRRDGFRMAARCAGLVALVLAAGDLLFGHGAAWHALGQETGLVTRFSMWRLASSPHDPSDVARAHYLSLTSGGFAVAVIPLLVMAGVAVLAAVPRTGNERPERAAGAATLAFLLAAPYVLPWYLTLALPLVALARSRKLVWVALGEQAALTVAYASTLHRHFGPIATALRSGYFETLALAQLVAALAIAGWWIVAAVRRRRAEVRIGRTGNLRSEMGLQPAPVSDGTGRDP
jgi:hypothetical protein